MKPYIKSDRTKRLEIVDNPCPIIHFIGLGSTEIQVSTKRPFRATVELRHN